MAKSFARAGKQIGGMGAATSSTSRVVLAKSRRGDSDVDFAPRQVAHSRGFYPPMRKRTMGFAVQL